MNLNLSLVLQTKINLRWIISLYIEAKTIVALRKENIKEYKKLMVDKNILDETQ